MKAMAFAPWRAAGIGSGMFFCIGVPGDSLATGSNVDAVAIVLVVALSAAGEAMSQHFAEWVFVLTGWKMFMDGTFEDDDAVDDNEKRASRMYGSVIAIPRKMPRHLPQGVPEFEFEQVRGNTLVWDLIYQVRYKLRLHLGTGWEGVPQACDFRFSCSGKLVSGSMMIGDLATCFTPWYEGIAARPQQQPSKADAPHQSPTHIYKKPGAAAAKRTIKKKPSAQPKKKLFKKPSANKQSR